MVMCLVSVNAGAMPSLLQLAHYTWYRDISYTILNGYEDIDRNMFFKHIQDSGTGGHKAALAKNSVG